MGWTVQVASPASTTRPTSSRDPAPSPPSLSRASPNSWRRRLSSPRALQVPENQREMLLAVTWKREKKDCPTSLGLSTTVGLEMGMLNRQKNTSAEKVTPVRCRCRNPGTPVMPIPALELQVVVALAHLLEVLQELARAQGHAEQRVLRQDHRHPGLLGHQPGEALQQRAPAGHHDD